MQPPCQRIFPLDLHLRSLLLTKTLLLANTLFVVKPSWFESMLKSWCKGKEESRVHFSSRLVTLIDIPCLKLSYTIPKQSWPPVASSNVMRAKIIFHRVWIIFHYIGVSWQFLGQSVSSITTQPIVTNPLPSPLWTFFDYYFVVEWCRFTAKQCPNWLKMAWRKW